MKLYQQCFLEHIPKNLHRRGRKLCKKFYLHEEIYRRCPTHLIDNPFATITLSDVSLNRQGNPRKSICQPDDVLFNVVDSTGHNVPKYNESVIILKIKRLLKNKTYKKVLTYNGNTLIMYLKHSPEPCNYSHTVFEFVLNDSIVTFDNYNNGLKKNAYKRLRDDCRLEISKMIIRHEIRI